MNIFANTIFLRKPSPVTTPIRLNIASTVFLFPSLNSGIEEIDSANAPKNSPIERPVLLPMNMLATTIFEKKPSLVTILRSDIKFKRFFIWAASATSTSEIASANAPKKFPIFLAVFVFNEPVFEILFIKSSCVIKVRIFIIASIVLTCFLSTPGI